MLPRIYRCLVLALLLLVPLQGTAAVVHAIVCAPHAASDAPAPGHASPVHEHASAGEAHVDSGGEHHHSHDTSSGSADSAHQCCHHLSAAPGGFVPPVRAELPVYQSSSAVLALSFVLEQPQRPPRP